MGTALLADMVFGPGAPSKARLTTEIAATRRIAAPRKVVRDSPRKAVMRPRSRRVRRSLRTFKRSRCLVPSVARRHVRGI